MPRPDLTIREVLPGDRSALVPMLVALWPDGTTRDHGRQVRSVLRGTPRSTLPLVNFRKRLGGRTRRG